MGDSLLTAARRGHWDRVGTTIGATRVSRETFGQSPQVVSLGSSWLGDGAAVAGAPGAQRRYRSEGYAESVDGIRRLVVGTVVALLAAGSLLAVDTSSASATMVGGHTLTLNMYGMRGSNNYNTAIVSELMDELNLRSPKPLVIMVEEVCQSQYNDLSIFLPSLGYSGQSPTDKALEACAAGSAL